MNTIADLGHPLIQETAKNLAWKQVGLGFCKPQDQQDLAQDLLLYLCRQCSRYTGKLPLVTWACRLLRGRINAINRRLFDIPSPSQQRRSRPTSEAVPSPHRASAPMTAPEPPAEPDLEQPATNQRQKPQQEQPEPAKTQTVLVFRTVTTQQKPEPKEPRNRAALLPNVRPDEAPPNEVNPNPQHKNAITKARSRPHVLCTEVGSWWQRLLLFRAAIVSRWQRSSTNSDVTPDDAGSGP